VLQGGGAKGAFQFGVLQRLHEAGIEFDVIAGTSVGALNGAIVATDAWDLGEQMWSDLTMGLAFRWSVLAAIYTFLSTPCILYLGWVATTYESLLPTWLRVFFRIVASLPLILACLAINYPVRKEAWWIKVLCLTLTLAWAAAAYYMAGKQNSLRLSVTIPYATTWVILAVIFAFNRDRAIFDIVHNLSLVKVLLILALSLSPLLLVGGYIHRWTNAALFDNSPLRKTVAAVVRKGICKPLFATTAEVIPDYVDPDDYEYGRFQRSTVWYPAEQSVFRPAYERVDTLAKAEVQKAVDALVRSAALPLGIVPNDRVGAKRVRFVDGGVTDNTPWFPLIDSMPCEQIVMVLCEPESDAKGEAEPTREMWRKRDRGIRVPTEAPKIPDYVGKWNSPPPNPVRNVPPKVVPLRDPQFWPESRTIDCVVISPRYSLGKLWGTMNFNRARAQLNIELGREVAEVEIKKGRLT
jgi:Patatin-like phospholipase